MAFAGAAPVRADADCDPTVDNTWTGGINGDGTWSDASNWSGGVPSSGQTLCFPAAGSLVWLPESFVNNPVVLDGQLTVNAASSPGATYHGFDGPITGDGGITAASGYIFFDTPSTFSGGVTLAGGNVNAEGAGTLGSGPVSAEDGVLQVDAHGFDNDITLSAQGALVCSDADGPNPPAGGLSVSGPIILAGSTTVWVDTPCSLSGPISGAYQLTIDNGVTLAVSGTNTYSGGTVIQEAGFQGVVSVAGARPLGTGPVRLQSGTLSGTGTIGDVTVATGTAATVAGTLAPGTPGQPDTLSTGALALAGGTKFPIELDSATGFDAVDATGAVSISGATLDVTLGTAYQPGPRAAFTIIRNQSGQPVSGTFGGLPEGSALVVGGTTFYITYQGNGENDVVISTVQPATPTPAPTPLASAYPLATPAPLTTPTPTITSSPRPQPTPIAVTSGSKPRSGGPPMAALLLAAAALILIAAGLALAFQEPIRRRATAWRHRGG
jgi:hypothetical protein